MDETARPARPGFEDTIFTLAPEGLGSAQSALGRTRLRTFITLRWLAVAGQSFAVMFVYFGLGFHLPLALCLAMIAASAWLNVFLSFAFPSQRLAREWEAALQLAFDTVQLATLLTLTGGLSNPFLLLLLAPVTVAALSLSPRKAAILAILALTLAALMPLLAQPLPWHHRGGIHLPDLYQWGHFAALAVGVMLFSVSAARVSLDEARLVRALDAASVVMAREQRLSALGAMSAMTAHELGTPLATIHLVVREMLNDLPTGDPRRDDLILIADQSERCRAILATIRETREASDIVHAQMPLDALVEEAVSPMKGLGVEITVTAAAGEGGGAKAPVIARSPEILHALGAFIENAVSFAASRVDASVTWTADQVVVTISDDGPGFSAEILPKLGEPYISDRSEARLGGGDMGLGFFIAKTLIERTGGRVATRNRTPPRTGAVVQAFWPIRALMSQDLD